MYQSGHDGVLFIVFFLLKQWRIYQSGHDGILFSLKTMVIKGHLQFTFKLLMILKLATFLVLFPSSIFGGIFNTFRLVTSLPLSRCSKRQAVYLYLPVSQFFHIRYQFHYCKLANVNSRFLVRFHFRFLRKRNFESLNLRILCSLFAFWNCFAKGRSVPAKTRLGSVFRFWLVSVILSLCVSVTYSALRT